VTRRRFLLLLVLLGLVVLAHGPSLSNPFQYDDWSYIVENDFVRSWPGPLRYLKPPVVDGGGVPRAFYRPLTMLSFFVSFQMGEGPLVFRLFNLGLHAAAVLMLFFLAQRLLGLLVTHEGQLGRASPGEERATLPDSTAAFAAAVFAVHPLVTHTLNEVSKRDTLLATAFLLGALLAYCRALESLACERQDTEAGHIEPHQTQEDGGASQEKNPNGRVSTAPESACAGSDSRLSTTHASVHRDHAHLKHVSQRRWWIFLCAGLACEVLALGSKEIAVSVPIFVVLWDVLFLKPRRPWAPRRLLVYGVALVPPVALGTVFLVWAAQGHLPAPLPYEPVPSWSTYVLSQPLVLLRYLGMLLAPAGLSAYHEVRAVGALSSPGFWVPCLGLVGLLGVALALWRRLPEVTLCVVGGIIHLLPVSVVRNPIAMEEDRAYVLVALYGLALAGMLGRAARRLGVWAGRRGRVMLGCCAGVCVLACAWLSHLRAKDWSSAVQLWASAVETYPSSRTALLFLAGALGREGRSRERLLVLEAATRLHPRDVRLRVFYAHALAQAGRLEEARALALRLQEEASQSAEVHTLAGHLHRAQGNLKEAVVAYRRALEADAGYVTACVYLADCLARMAQAEEARRLLRCVRPHLRLSPEERSIVARLRQMPRQSPSSGSNQSFEGP